MRTRHIHAVAMEVKQFAAKHEGRAPEQFAELWDSSRKEELAEVLWPTWSLPLIGKRPVGWPQSPEDLNNSPAYVRVKKHYLDGKSVCIIEREELRKTAREYTFAVADTFEIVWVKPE